MGSEIYWHGILDYSGRDNRRLREVADVHKILKKMQCIAGAKYQAQIGIIKEYDNVWDSELDVWHGRIEWSSQAAWFRTLQKNHTPFNYCFLDHMTVEDICQYKLLVYPHAVILTEETVAKLKAYVEQGGTLLLGCRAGYKDSTGKCVMLKLPGLIKDLCGVDIPEYSYVSPDDGKAYADWDGTKLHADVFNDQLEVEGTGKVEARYVDTYYAGIPALISNQVGAGKVYYFGGAFSDETVEVFIDKLGVKEPYKDIVELPQCCEVAVREKNGIRYMFILNYTKNTQDISLSKVVTDLYAGENVQGTVSVEGYGVKIYVIDDTIN